MEIRKVGPLPEDNFLIMPNASIRDSRLSYRARGLMAVISSHATGFHISSDELAEGGAEGVRAIRTAMNELIEHNYMRRIRSQDEQGRWRTDIDVYIWGDAPALSVEPVIDDDFGPQVVDAPATDGPKPPVGSPEGGFRPAVSVPVREDHPRRPSPTSPIVDAAGDPPTTEVAQQQPISQPVNLPIVERRKLQGWFHITDAAAASAWEAAWTAACGVTTAHANVEYDPQAHLAIYLSKCREERRTPRSDLWLRFFIEDRAKHIQVLANEEIKRAEETPQEREDRMNRRQPPAEWGVPHTEAVPETGEPQ